MGLQYLQSFIAGLLISLSGSLPLGNLNVAAMQIALKETLRNALWFAGGVVFIEIVYLIITLNILGRLMINDKMFLFFRIASIILLLIMALGSFTAVKRPEGKNIILNNKARRSFLGVAMSAVNPMQVPFWTGWAVYLLSRSLLVNSALGFTVFVLSAGIGTFTALLLFIFAGRRFSSIMLRNQKQVNVFMGCLFTIMAIAQFIKLW